MPDDIISTFLAAAIDERMRMAQDPSVAPHIAAYLGAGGWEEYERIAKRFDTGEHLDVSSPPNLVFVPGVMGSVLQSRHMGGIWWFDVRARKNLNHLRLNAAGDSAEDPKHEVDPCTVDLSYEPFAAAVLAQNDFGHRFFAYDWRKSLELSAGRLRALVEQCHQENGGKPVHLVAHSMGGLMVRAALMQHGDVLWPMLGQIVYVGTPHYGAPAIAGYLKNHFWGRELLLLLGMFLDRETFRTMRGVLGLLPAPIGTYPGTRPGDQVSWKHRDGEYAHPCANFDLYRAESWQLDLTPAQTARLQDVLDGAADLHRRMDDHHRSLSQEQRDRMLVIAGVGKKTLFRLAFDRGLWGLWNSTEKVTKRIEKDPHREGDGRVPVASAQLENVEIRYVKGVHGGLTNIPAVSQDIFRWLRGKPLQLPSTPAGALSQHLADEATSEAPHLDGTAAAGKWDDDPGYWDPVPLTEAELAALDSAVDEGSFPEFALTKIL
jgi:pimeloyl-ACP methyl ester carboxylesterase